MNFLKFIFTALTIINLIDFPNVFGNTTTKIDPNGYIVFCPCMGRFGNQMDQFLGALAFAKGIDRTLVLPHLVEYPERALGSSEQIPFQKYFKVEPLSLFAKVIPMDLFMEKIAPVVWPKGNRTVICYSSRDQNSQGEKSGDACKAKEGNPFGPFWDNFKIDFDNSEFYAPLSFGFNLEDGGWNKKFPPSEYKVLAFSGAPGAFPVEEKNVHLQKYLKWSDFIEKQADDFIKSFKSAPGEKFIALHLRNGIDFKRACEHVKETKGNFFATAQCLGYRNEFGQINEEICYPTEKIIIKQVRLLKENVSNAIKKLNAQYVYIAADGDDMILKFQKKFKKVKFLKYKANNPHVDLCIMGKADLTILNCASTFSAFAKRQRDSENKITEFWAFSLKKETKKDETDL